MKKELPKAYNPTDHEDAIYQKWEASGYFNPDNLDKTQGRHCNILPPPNANGELHLGHSSGYTVMDIFGRHARMNGKKTLLLPGKDHAGIQTQVVFEKLIEKERGINRYSLGRDIFYKEIYDFCIDRSAYMRAQEKRIGISADWSRERFTLDPKVLKIAMETFVQMEKDGLIYKGKRIINWCPRCASALADVEVLHKESPGKIYTIKYPLKDSPDFIKVATTRPETMLGDSAVAVNPTDDRFTHLIGKNVILPLQNKVIPIIGDKRIDVNFGTGAVKITPAHDPLDWQIGKDHQLEEISVVNEKATVTAAGGKYQGLNVIEARNEIVSDLDQLGLLEKIEEITHSVSICERCKTVIEPLISKQWFINVDAQKFSLKKSAISAIDKGEIKIFPENFSKILTDWFDNLHDWCISRQIWWGPRFPVWYCANCGEEKYIVSLEKPVSCPHCAGSQLTQDENTFDTWFSSGQWVHTTLLSNKNDFKQYYPSDIMITGRDLLFFWTSRMIMLSLYRTGKIPFSNLFFTGLIRDKDGQKMSKSKGNGIDPLLMIDKFGADALRMSLIMDTAPGQDSRLYEEKIETFRNFANKLWNISRYCLSQENFKLLETIPKDSIHSAADHWIINRLNQTITKTNSLFDKKLISLAAEELKSFTWDEFADWYVEISKQENNQRVLGYVLDKLLRLWHPFMPFVTEHIWSLAEEKQLLMVSKWPNSDSLDIDPHKFENANIIIEKLLKPLVIAIRNARAENKIEAAKKIPVIVRIPTSENDLFKIAIESQSQILQLKKLQTGVDTLSIEQSDEKIDNAIYRTAGPMSIFVPLAGIIDTDKEKIKVQKEIASLEKYATGLETKLKNKDFLSKAPESIVTEQQLKLKESRQKITDLEKRIASLD